MNNRTKLLQALDGRKPRVLELQRALTSFPAFDPDSGGEGEWRKAEWLDAWMEKVGLTHVEHLDSVDTRVPAGKRPNRIVRVPGKSQRTLWVLGHLDVVPPGELSFWKTDPWTLTVDENDPDMIRGRGVEDNQQAVVAALLVAADLVEQGIEPDIGFGIILVADEETGNSHGVDYVFGQRPHLVALDDLVLVPDFGTAAGTLIEVAEKGVLWLKVTVLGQQCHGSTPDMGHNSLLAAAEMITRVPEVERLFDRIDPLFDPPRTTIVPTRHDANVPNINTIPGKDVFYIDSRVLPGYDMNAIAAAVDALGQDVAHKHSVNISVEAIHTEPVFPPTSPDSEVVQRLMRAIKSVYGIECRAGGVGGSTVAGRLRRLNIPAAVWARVIPNYHAPNEGSRLSYTVGDAKVYAHLLFNESE